MLTIYTKQYGKASGIDHGMDYEAARRQIVADQEGGA